jgi:DNA-binding MarR family transcriptional regulator
VTLDRAVAALQFAYPQIYYACHTRHARGRSNDRHLSPRDSQMLVHLESLRPLSVSLLAHHMGLAVSTVSEATTKLERFGYVSRCAADGRDRRRVGLTLTDKGRAAVQNGSVLETGRLRTVLRRLSSKDRTQLISAMTRLARACGPSMEDKRGWGDA